MLICRRILSLMSSERCLGAKAPATNKFDMALICKSVGLFRTTGFFLTTWWLFLRLWMALMVSLCFSNDRSLFVPLLLRYKPRHLGCSHRVHSPRSPLFVLTLFSAHFGHRRNQRVLWFLRVSRCHTRRPC